MREQLALKQKTEANEMMNSDVMKFIESEIGQVNLTPCSCRMLKMKQKEQDKRLVSLTLAKRKTAAEIKKELMKQHATAQKQVNANSLFSQFISSSLDIYLWQFYWKSLFF